MALPPDLLWASTSAIWRTAISSLTADQGQEPLTPAVVEEVNQALYVTSLWTAYAKAFLPADKSITVGRITGNGDPGGSGRGLIITTDGTGTGILIAPPSGDALALTTTGAADITLESTRNLDATSSSATGTMTFGVLVGSDRTGVRIDHANRRVRIDGGVGVNAAGLRYPYQASLGLSVVILAWPGLGGWVTIGSTAGAADLTQNEGSGLWSVYNQSGGAVDVEARRPLHELTANAEAAASIYEITAFAVVWGGGASTATVKLMRKPRATALGTTALITLTVGSPSWTGTQAIDTATYSYYLLYEQASVSGSGGNSDTVENVEITLRKFAVE